MRTILRRFWLVVGLAVVIPAAEVAAEGKSLRDRLSELSDPRGLTLDADGTPVTLIGTFDFFGPAVQRLAIRGTDFPITSTVPGFSYVYDPQLQVLERSTQLGPVFSERAGTVGRGRVEFGGSFLFANLDEVDGRGFGSATGLFRSGDFFVLEDLTVDSFRLETYWFNTYLTYGVTDRWDVNVLLPFVYSNMRVRARRTFTLLEGDTILGSTAPQRLSADGEAFGIGDVLVRTKYRFLDGPVNVAGALSVRTPTGNEEDFAGLGDVTVTPAAILSVPMGPHSLHASFGFEVNADDLERTRARYTIGASFQIIKQVAFLLDFLGSSALVDDEFTVVGQGLPVRGLEFVRLTDDGRDTVLAVPRTDLLDAAAGLKVAISDNVVAFGGVIVPLNDDGIRAEVIPTGGIEVGF